MRYSEQIELEFERRFGKMIVKSFAQYYGGYKRQTAGGYVSNLNPGMIYIFDEYFVFAADVAQKQNYWEIVIPFGSVITDEWNSNTDSTKRKSVGVITENNGKQLVCALGNRESDGMLHEEILYIAYKWAKLKILLEALKEKKLDASFVTEKVNTIKNKLEEFRAIRTQCANIETANEEIRTISRRAEKSINEQLSEILESLRADS